MGVGVGVGLVRGELRVLTAEVVVLFISIGECQDSERYLRMPCSVQ